MPVIIAARRSDGFGSSPLPCCGIPLQHRVASRVSGDEPDESCIVRAPGCLDQPTSAEFVKIGFEEKSGLGRIGRGWEARRPAFPDQACDTESGVGKRFAKALPEFEVR